MPKFVRFLSLGVFIMTQTVAAMKQQPAKSVPLFQVDPLWPHILTNNWIVGQVSAVAVDSHDHVWILHRPATLAEDERAGAATPPRAECCVPAPPVLEFDEQGNVVRGWGGVGLGYEWPSQEHGLTVDSRGNVWISGTGQTDGQILKFTREGKFLLQIGHTGQRGGNQDTSTLGRPADMSVDAKTDELYVADGEGGNRRVIVFEAATGAYKRHWGAYGGTPDNAAPPDYRPEGPPPKAFSRAVHCIRVAHDGLVYVCDRGADRIQVFRRDGTFVKEVFIASHTLGTGSTSQVAFSPDEKWLYVADGTNQKVWIAERDSLQVVGSFGHPGHNAGQFRGLHGLAVDSKGRLYTAEVLEGRRIQRYGLLTGKDATLLPFRYFLYGSRSDIVSSR